MVVEIEQGLFTAATVIDSAAHADVSAGTTGSGNRSHSTEDENVVVHTSVTASLPHPNASSASNPRPEALSRPRRQLRSHNPAVRCPKNNTDWQWLSNWTLPILNLTACALENVPKELFHLTILTTLDLHLNSFTSIPAGLEQLTSLTYLDMANNLLASVPMELYQLTTLKHLDLHFNQLTSLSQQIRNLTALTYLDVSFNNLTRMPPELGSLADLATLGFGGALLTTLPAEVWALTALTKLFLSSNRLSVLPTEIGGLTALTKLYLSNNRLSALPAEIGQLTKLTKLDVSDNFISSLPKEVWQLDKLTKLYLSTNPLGFLPAEIGLLNALNKLYLFYTRLSRIPPEIGHLANLTDLVLAGNHLTAIPLAINNLTGLETLRLERNRIRTLPSLQALRALTYLYLDDNELSALPGGGFGGLSQLEVLSLASNDIQGDVTQALAGLRETSSLRLLNISHNAAFQLDSEWPFLHLKVLDISRTGITVAPSMCTSGVSIFASSTPAPNTGWSDVVGICAAPGHAKLLDVSARRPLEIQDALWGSFESLAGDVFDAPASKISFRLQTSDSPAYCNLQNGYRTEYDSNKAQTEFPVLEYRCFCDAGYVTDSSGVCTAFWGPARIAAVVVGGAFLAILGTLAATVARSRLLRNRRRMALDLDLHKSLLEETTSDVLALTRAWEVDWHELVLTTRIDQAAEGTFGQVS